MNTSPDTNLDFSARITTDASPDRVMHTLTTLDGLAGWWTTDVSGNPTEAGTIRFGFGKDHAVMQVNRITPTTVEWTCLEHTKFTEWAGATITVQLEGDGPNRIHLDLEHRGLVPSCECYGVCSGGWHHYLASLAEHAAGRTANPFGSEGWTNRPR